MEDREVSLSIYLSIYLSIIGKTEKLVYQTLADLGLPNGKTEVIELEEQT